MESKSPWRGAVLAAAIGGVSFLGGAICLPVVAQQAQADAQADVQASVEGEVLMRGPIHEAFAAPVELTIAKGVTIAKEPPEAIEEVAPDQKPAGENVVWIPGYWAFDDERDDFFWVTGLWRSVPAGVSWVPGYWVSADSGYQWVNGFWMRSDAELTYLPEPPATKEAGYTTEAPSADHFWVPGHWQWTDGRYAWRAGFWQRAYSGWMWIPARYVWTPRGYLYTAGYWDYDLSQRGLLFAPVYFNQGVYSRRGFAYTPSVVLNAALLATELFVRPSYRQYYFGDYYGNDYMRAGFTPWISYASVRTNYDPLYAYARWHYRSDRAYFDRLQRDLDDRARNAESRPARTFAEMSKKASGDRAALAARLKDFEKSVAKDSRIKLEAVSKEAREEAKKTSASLAKLRKERRDLDGREAVKGEKAEPAKFEISKSPVVSTSKSADRQPPRSDDEPEKTAKKGTPGDNPRDPEKTESPKKELPKTELPKKDPPKVDPPKREPPKAEPPKTDPPKADPPKRDPPKADPPKADPPKADPPKADPPKKDPPKADPPKKDPPKVDPPKADPPRPIDPPKGNPPKIDPPKKDPPKVNPPKGVDPPKVDPPKVDPPKVNPPKANPPKADPPKAPPKKDDDKQGALTAPSEVVVQAAAIPEVSPKRVYPVPLLDAKGKDVPAPILEARRVFRKPL